MPLSDTKLRALRPREKTYQVSDGRGLFIEVLPTGKRVWRLRYRFQGRQEKVTLGEYPSYSLVVARRWCEECRAQVARGVSPMREKRAAKERENGATHVDELAQKWLDEVVARDVKDPKNIKRALSKDILPAIGKKKLSEVTPIDVLTIVDRIKARGAPQMALVTRNFVKRMYAYAIARHLVDQNPAAAIEARYIATPKPRTVFLSPEEVGVLMRAIYKSDMKRANKLALHLLLLTLVRKSELVEATWDEVNFDEQRWEIPAARMKKDRPHIVYLSTQALALFQELGQLSYGSDHVLPSRSNSRKPISKSALNAAIRTIRVDLKPFVIHDFRRTASTLLHENGFNSDVIEKALAHEQTGVRGVYNRAEYADQRRELLQWWADFIEAQVDEPRKVIIGRFGGSVAN